MNSFTSTTKLANKFYKLCLLTLLTVTLSVISSQKAQATHAAGADLTYRCLGGLQYELEATFYRDCGGVAEPASITINYASVIKGVNLTVTANKIAGTGQEVTVPCQTSASTCNSGSSVGIRKFVYRATVTLSSAATDWVFSYSVCCRNCAITTIQNPCANTSLIYVEAKLNNQVATCNSSPVFSNVPIAFVCIGQNFSYNHGVLDADGDSLAYQIITPKIGATTNVTYIAPNSTTMPVQSSTPFTVNALTGDMNFTPTMQQIGILAILVKEYRNGVQIGSVIRDMQVYTVPCTNSLPTASGINGSNNFSVNVCANQQVCFTINTNDADAAQVVTAATNIAQSIPTATVTVGAGTHPTLTFCWTPTIADIGPNPNTFTVTVRDNACPTNGVQTFSYSLYVPGPDFTVSSTNITCNGAANGTATATAGTGFTYSWNTTPVQTTATATNLAPGTYAVTVTNAGGCTITKSVTITQPPALTVTNTISNVVCVGQCNGAVDLTASGGTGTLSYAWSNGQTTQDVIGLCAATYTVTVTDANNCKVTLNPVINTTSNITGAITPTHVLCTGRTTGDADLTVSGGTGTYQYLWSNGSTAEDLSGVNAGTYSVTVTDGSLCTKSFSVTINQPALSLSVNNSITNINCFGNSTGAINLAVNGGTSPYAYLWSNGATTQNLSGIPTGTYSVTVTDGNGCTAAQASVNVAEPAAALTAATLQTNVNCFGNNTGSINVTPAGGTAPYAYNWSNGSTSQDLTNIVAGTYSVTITDSKGCTTTASALSITQPAASLTSSVASVNVNCFGDPTGSITLTANGGTTPYNFAWSNGATTQNLSGIASGNYAVTVTDANGCTSSQASINITQPAASLATNNLTTNVNCFGNNTGAINLTITGGTTPYSYQWSNGANTQDITNVASGTYTVTVTDANGCTNNIASMTISQPTAALSANNAISNVNCFGNNSGAIDMTVQGGTIPYNYQWSNGATSQDINNIPAGTYTVTITDANGCTSASASMNITQPSAALAAAIGGTQQVNCFGNNTGAINLTVNGGTTPYTFSWSNGATTQNLASIPAGTYTVNVTDANGCNSAVNSISITQPSASLSASVTGSQNVSCNGGGNGSIDLTVNGGTSPYNYNWSNGATTQDISNLLTGAYSVTITDANGCSTAVNSAVTQPAGALASSISSSQNVLCFGGNNAAINLNVSGGTGPYSYAWSNSATTQDITGLAAGTYSVTVSDANGCTSSATQTITQPTGALSAAGASSQSISCFGLSNGAITLTVNGGTSPYNYQWSNGASTQNLSNIAAGTYNVTVIDANSCVTNANGITVTQPAAALSSSVNATQNVGCFGNATGSISINVAGGTTPYSYNWSNGATTQSISNLSAGNYSATITDANGCSTTVNATVTQPAGTLASSISSSQNVLCFGGNNAAINLNVSGGTGPYAYVWSNSATTQDISGLAAGTYSVTVSDANGCTSSATQTITQPSGALSAAGASSQSVSCHGLSNGAITLTVNGGTSPYNYQWSNGASTQNLSNIAAGTYNVTVIDANSCVTNANGITVTQPAAALASSVNATQNVGCFGNATGSISINVAGGTTPYSYNWSNGATTQSISNLTVGSYSVSITDANGCTSAVNAIAIAQPANGLASSVGATQNVSCFGGNNATVNLSVNGGTQPYTYQWSNGATTQDLNGIAAGTYGVTVTDANGCTTQVNAITISQPAAGLSMSNTSTNVACFGNTTASITLSVNGGTSPYSYNWSNGASTQNLTNIPAGTYSVVITDANGCTANGAAVSISQPSAALSTSTSSTQVLCFGNNTGAINLTVAGGTSPYNYSWSNGATTANLQNIIAGTYTVTVTDANGCTSQQASMQIQQPAATLTAGVGTTTDVSCNGGQNGGINLTVSGGTSPYSFVWSNGAVTQNITGATAGLYSVTITDAHGCTRQITPIGINQPTNPITSSITTGQNVSCNGGGNGSIDLTVSGGTSPYAYNWSNGGTTQDISGLYAGTYGVSITDANGCTAAATGTVSQPAGALSTSIAAAQNILCFGGNNGSITLQASGGTTPYSFVWSNGATTQSLTNLAAGSFSVTVTDGNGCISTSSAVITQPSATLNAALTTANAVLCNGGNNGSIDVTITGGTAPYNYAWSNGATSQDLTGLSSGSFTLSVTDANGCATTLAAIAINQPAAALASAINVNNVNCFGNNTGAIDLTITGGTSPYNYSWSNGATTQDLQNIAAGVYTVMVTDANGCTVANNAMNVTQPPAALTTGFTVNDVNCFGNATGAISLSVSGGTTPYAYQWSNGATTPNLINVTVGTYTVTVTDANGCTNLNASMQISQPSAAMSMNNAIHDVNCFGGNTGSIDLTVSGGTMPYTYNWSNGAATEDLIGVASGTYTVTVTDAQGCTVGNSTLTILQPTAALASTVAGTDQVNCYGNSTGAIDLTITGGTSPYNYAWSNGATTQDLLSIPAGTYTVSVTDAQGCTSSIASITIGQPAAALSSTVASTGNVACNGGGNGAVDLTVTGGTSPYIFTWSNGATTEDISNLYAGSYNVSITDANGCTSNATATVTQPAGALASSVSASQNILCFNQNTGSVTLNVVGGTAPYSYQWSNGATTQNINNVASGNYSVTVTDANNCISTSSATLTQPNDALNASTASIQNVSCFGIGNGAINLNVIGGTSPYSYSWSNGATTQNLLSISAGTYTVSVTDAQGCTTSIAGIAIGQPAAALSSTVASTGNVACNGGGTGAVDLTVAGGTSPYTFTWSNGATTEDISNLYAGSYNVSITDANGCTSNATATVTQPAGALASSVSASQNILCFSQNTGSVTLNVVGGTAPYSYQWSNGATTQNINNVASGSYSVTVTDANNCISTSSATLTQPNDALNANAASTQNVSCFGIGDGAINLNVIGGTSPYSYSWSNGAATQNLANLQAGVYSVTVTDANGCVTNVNAVTISQPALPLNASIGASQNVNCFGQSTGSISLGVTGGTSPYTYAWSNGATSQTISNLPAGTYSVTITDANNCTTVINSIAINEPGAALNATVASTQNVSCTGGGNGALDLTVAGGTMPYSYAWNTGAITEDLTGLLTGTYTVTVIDVNGCTSNITANVTQPASSLSSNVNASVNVNCFGGNNGAIDLTIAGGTTPYSFVWNTGETTEDLNNLTTGTYSVIVTDGNGCTVANTVTITQPSAVLASAVTSSQNINCFGGNNGAIDLTVTGGTTPYQFAWDNGATSEDLTGLSSGTYNVTVTDANGCTSVNSVFLNQPGASLATAVTNSQNVFCFGGSNGFIDLSINGGTTPYTILWSNGATTQNLSSLVAGTYNVTVTDVNGCSSTSGITIAEPAAALNTTISAAQPVLCFGNSTGSIDISVTGGTLPYTYSWSNGAVTEDLSNIPAGSYSVNITDAQGCTSTINANITEPQGALASTVSINQNVSCFGGNNASVDLTAAGGTPPYSYVWSNGATSEDINNLSAGIYTVTITDANGCNTNSAATISQPSAALSGNINQTAPVLCNGGTDGAVDLTIAGGTSPYAYVWSNGAITEDLANIPAGTYTVTVTDINGCTFNSSIIVTQPQGGLTPTIASTNDVGCYGNSTGSVTLNITGGTLPYQFVWSNGATTQNLTNIPSGSYTVTVTDANGCTNSIFANVQQPNGSLAASPSFNTVNCDTLNSVDIILNPFGGTPPYAYQWNTGNTSENLLNVTAGNYAVTVTDANGCSFSASVNVQGPTTLFAVTSTTTNAGCNGNTTGSITLTATGGISPYTYLWNTGATTSNLTNIASGTYTATVNDSYGCTRTVTVTVNQPSNAIAATLVANNVLCYNDSSGVIIMTVTGGTAPYNFLWSNGSSTQNATGITIGTYTVIITDANGCSMTDTASITQPASALTVKGYETNSNCLNNIPGAVDINITGGTPPFTYVWSNGATTQNIAGVGAGTYTVSVTDANGCLFFLTKTIVDESVLTMTANGPTEFCMGGIANLQTQVVTNGNYQWYYNNAVLTGANQNVYSTPVAGVYYVSVTNACGTFNSNPIEVKVYQVGNIAVSANTMICPKLGEFATLSAYGGSTYRWTPGYGLSDSTIANPVATPEQSTTYRVVVTSSEGCSATAEVMVTIVCDTLFVPTGFSPDGNNFNDTYVIDGLSKYPGNKIYIYNRWGNLVYKKKDYDNTWDGTSNVSGIYLGKQLPSGTYFFILDLNNGSKPMQGYLTLKK